MQQQVKQLNQNVPTIFPIKRLVMTAGDARIGKSTTARLLIELYLESKLNLRAYYTGNRNKLYAYELLLPISKLSLTQGGADQLLIDLQQYSQFQVAITDMPGQSFEQFKNFAEEVLLWDAIASLGYRITFVHPVSYRRDCIEYLQELINYCGDKADYVVTKNLYFGDEFPYYDGSDIQKYIQDAGGGELCLGALWKGTYELVESLNMSYSEAVQNSEIDLLNRSRIFNWMAEFQQQIKNNERLFNLLGLSFPSSFCSNEQQLDIDF
ncbi:MAG: hypothetical protein KME28_15940 [Pelatocladus maniniholoensis HA4357-MV3]|jgi:hypothetical protein|uniref:Uncharacterized protein n=1 Tax=Pelatocladus maniniholoensis HA4357-MV3 TaxID=1117104 RepID=A0A9E3LUM5_9NOST|nr:hypothetical protein [Pelatocladus maniniholoensis HA4357-MV3]